MPVIGITGGYGFLGWHLRCRLRALRPEARVILAGRDDFGSPDDLDRFVSSCDQIIHLAGANRGSETEVQGTNVGVATKLVEALKRVGATPALVFGNSIQCDGDSLYGRSKREASQILGRWSSDRGTRYCDVVLPNLFGEQGRPFYNSVVATFCHQLVHGEKVKVNPSGLAPFLHAQDASRILIDCMNPEANGRIDVAGVTVTVPELYDRLKSLHAAYQGQTFPKLDTRLDLQLFNTLRSFRFPDLYPIPLKAHSDVRGTFVELGRGHGEIQVSFSTTGPSVTRGNHFHLEKIERFVVLAGVAVIRVRRLFDTQVHSFRVGGDEPVAVDMPTMHSHNISNAGPGEMLTVFWANDHFDPGSPDTYPELVRAEA